MAAPLIVGNWKMNGLTASLHEMTATAAGAAGARARVVFCPPATLIRGAATVLARTGVEVGGQDCRSEPSGAFTGDLSALMLADAGAAWVILGHSERRSGHGETDDQVAAKTSAALAAGLKPIVCVGETLEQRRAGQALEVVTGQVRRSLPAAAAGAEFAVAYEPVWAIGTGLTPTLHEIAEIHAAVRATLTAMFGASAAPPILYGGSVKPANAAEILGAPEVGGALVGGASLKAADFLEIIRAA